MVVSECQVISWWKIPFRYNVGLVGRVRGSAASPGELAGHEGFCRFAVERGDLPPHCAGGLTESWEGIYMDIERITLPRSAGLPGIDNLSHLGKRVRGGENNKHWDVLRIYIYFTCFHSLPSFFEFTLHKSILFHKRLALLLGLLLHCTDCTSCALTSLFYRPRTCSLRA